MPRIKAYRKLKRQFKKLQMNKKVQKKMINGFGRTGFILGADCTLATEQDMGRLRAAIEAAQDMKEEI